MTTNPLHEKLIEEIQGECKAHWIEKGRYHVVCGAPKPCYKHSSKEDFAKSLRTAFLQIEQAKGEECVKKCQELKLQEYYCTSGCGCKYPNGDGSHEHGCIWRPDTKARQENLLLNDVITKLTT